jgi:CBS domain containing-hemolysin-like protein
MDALLIAAQVGAYILLMAASLTMGAMFCGLETGIYVLNKVRLELRCERGQSRARHLRDLLKSPHNLLATILIGTNIAGYLTTFAASGIFLLTGTAARTEYYTIALTTPLLFIFAESVPKNVFRRGSERLTYRFSWVLRTARRVFTTVGLVPLVRGFSTGLTRLIPGVRQTSPLANAGIAAALAESHVTGLLTHNQLAIADRIMNISNVALKEAMQPMDKVVKAPMEISPEELARLFREHNFSRLPLMKEGRVRGICDMYQALSDPAEKLPASYMAPALLLNENTPVVDAILTMQREKAVMAVVVGPDASGPPLGIVTLKDLVEPIVGKLRAW